MENFTLQILDTQGQLQYQLQATYMAHYADDDRSELIKPQFIAFRPDGQRWTAVAETGLAIGGTDKIMLNGAVIIQRNNSSGAPVDLEIRTRDLNITPADDYAETDMKTTIIHGKDSKKAISESVGLQVYFRKGQLNLLSQVKGVYAPQ